MWPPWVGGGGWPEQAPLPGRPNRAAPTKFSYLSPPRRPPRPPPGLGIGRGPLSGADHADPRALRLARLAVVRLRILDAWPLRAPHGHLRPSLRLPARPDLPPGGPGAPPLPPGAGPPRSPGDSGIAHPSLPGLPLAGRRLARRRSALPDRPAPRSPGRRLDGPRPPPLDAGARRGL